MGAVCRVLGCEQQRGAQEASELCRRHFTGALGEVPMLYAPAALYLLDWQIIGRVGDDHRGGFSAHEAPKARGGKGVSAQELVRAELPQIADSANGLLFRRGDIVGGIELGVDEIAKQRVDLSRLERGKANVEAGIREQGSELFELKCKGSAIPPGVFDELIVGEEIRSPFSVA